MLSVSNAAARAAFAQWERIFEEGREAQPYWCGHDAHVPGDCPEIGMMMTEGEWRARAGAPDVVTWWVDAFAVWDVRAVRGPEGGWGFNLESWPGRPALGYLAGDEPVPAEGIESDIARLNRRANEATTAEVDREHTRTCPICAPLAEARLWSHFWDSRGEASAAEAEARGRGVESPRWVRPPEGDSFKAEPDWPEPVRDDVGVFEGSLRRRLGWWLVRHGGSR